MMNLKKAYKKIFFTKIKEYNINEEYRTHYVKLP